ncbi:E3 ubiquitin/ISG15 ligase TRIM25-like isoform 1-T1 [Anomaloglossus baeobatrachus]|uniref:E3 ubiquitin/ISG15 ligase TRIM25-like n=1 Tax=Anomaloglossus baeobatrachus TaxID=238106 RepID=UPI003F50A288
MATVAFLCSEYLYCPVCLDLFRDPVTIPCGHTFCLTCITQCWSLQGTPSSCPQCRSSFRPDSSPRLCKNSILAQMVDDFSSLQGSNDFNAFSSHARSMGLPLRNQCQEEMPDAILETESSNDLEASIVSEGDEAPSSQVSVTRHRRVVSQGFSDMVRILQASGFRLLQMMEQAEKQMLKNSNSQDQEEGLVMKSAQVVPDQQQDQLVTMQEEQSTFQELQWTGLYAAVSKFKQCLQELCADHMGRLVQQVRTTRTSYPILPPKLWGSPLLPLMPRVRKEFLHYSRNISLDPDTAHNNLCLMQANRRVLCKLQPQAYPENTERFDHYTQVLARESMAQGRHYWEVHLSGNRVSLGVTYHGISRKGHQSLCLVGRNSHSWCLEWSSTRCYAWHDGERMLVATGQQENLGVFLDWDEGTLSFHEASDDMPLLYRFHASFTQPLYPIFFISWNSIVSIGAGTAVQQSAHNKRFQRQFSAEF